jgi:hypothetical protein
MHVLSEVLREGTKRIFRGLYQVRARRLQLCLASSAGEIFFGQVIFYDSITSRFPLVYLEPMFTLLETHEVWMTNGMRS